jgi:hypothetical protein
MLQFYGINQEFFPEKPIGRFSEQCGNLFESKGAVVVL